MKNQKGFATLEIILMTAIISILTFVAVPRLSQIIDKMTLDYEVKHLFNTISLQNVLNRSADFNPETFKWKFSSHGEDKNVELKLLTDTKQYKLVRENRTLGEVHKFPESFKIVDNNPYENSRTITITSRFGNEAKIIRDSVERWRISRNGK